MVESDIKVKDSNKTALKELQDRTLYQIFSVCQQKPSATLINQIARQMDLPPKRIGDFFNHCSIRSRNAARKLKL